MSALERRAVASLALLYSFRMLGLFMVLPLLALYAADLPGASPSMIGLALGIYGLTQALLQVPFGLLSDRIGRKPVIVAGMLLFAAGSLLAAEATTVGEIVVGRALQGAGAIAGTLMALVADLTRAEQRTKAMALVGISIGFSFTVALVLGPLVAGWGGLAAVFRLTAVLALVGIAMLLWLVPTPQAPAAQGDRQVRGSQLLATLLDADLARLNLGVFVLHFVLMAIFLQVPGMLELETGIGRDAHWSVYLPALLLSLLGMVPLMILAERMGRARRAFGIAVTLVLCSLFLMTGVRGALAVYAVIWLFFVGFNYLEATLPSLVSKTVGSQHKGTALGVFSTCQFLGAFCGGALGGWLLQHWGGDALLYACAALCLVWLLAAVKLRLPPATPAATGLGEPLQVDDRS